MSLKRNLFFTLILFLIIFSISFVSASDDLTYDTNTGELTALSVCDANSIEQDLNEVKLDSVETNPNNVEIKSIDENLGDNELNSIEETSNHSMDLKNDEQDNEEIESDSLTLTNKAQLQASNDEPILGAVINLYGGTVQNIMDNITHANPGDIIYLNGGTYTGNGYLDAGENEIITIKDIKVFGGSATDPNLKATLTDNWWGDYQLNFKGKGDRIPASNNSKTGYYSTSGVNLINVTFENLVTTAKLFNFCSGSLTDCVINNCESQYQFMGMCGSYFDKTPIPVINCNFTNCHQLYEGGRGVDDGSGQLGAVFGVYMENCNFVNTSSAHHGGALCIADESEWGSARIPSHLKNCSFIDIESRWFAIYLHGNFSTSFDYLDESDRELIEDCHFINCTGTGEYSGGIGISHNNVIIRNSEFINCTGGQGGAIMVGGINGAHEGFAGRNTVANNVLIENCNFTDNVAKETGQSSSLSPKTYKELANGEERNPDVQYYRRDGDNYIPDPEGTWYVKHEDVTFPPSGDAGAVYVYGNDTIIRNCIFNSNTADEGNGAAVYIIGNRTIVENTEFYDHNSENGTVYILGNDAKIIGSDFHDNTAITGACIYIEGNNTEVSNTEFKNNEATNGGCIYIVGDNSKINSNSKFESNNAENGAGVYIDGSNTEISATTFLNNNATNGAGVYIEGDHTTITGSNFDSNNATDGGAVYIDGDHSLISSSTFSKNNVTDQGGAVYIEGDNSVIRGNTFSENEAVPASAEGTTGLGGAIYVKGDNTLTDTNTFSHNKARNGSAIYTDGNNFNLQHDTFLENQAWSYLLVTTAEPPSSYYDESDVLVNITHVGGDNIINAIHNTADNDQIHFLDVTYRNSYGINENTGQTKIEPVDGAVENQLYQDDREYGQIIELFIQHEDGTIVLPPTNFTTGIYGNVSLILRKPLKVGNYTVYAKHPEDWNYKAIDNTTKFEVLPLADLEITKGVSAEEVRNGSTVTWTITVTNYGPDKAVNATVVDLIPSGLIYTAEDIVVSKGSFANNKWTIGDMELGETQTMTVTTIVNATNTTIVNNVNVTSETHDPNETNNNDSNKTVVLPEADLEVTKLVSAETTRNGSTVVWTIIVKNNGPDAAINAYAVDVIPSELIYTAADIVVSKGSFANNKWTIGDMANGETQTMKITTIVNATNTTIVNNVNVTSETPDPNETNNNDSNKTVVSPEADLEVIKQVSAETTRNGSTVVWTIIVKNNGPDTAINAIAEDIIPSTLIYTAEDIVVSKGSFTGNKWTIGDMANGETQTMKITTIVNATNTTIVNNVNITSETPDPNETNNNDSNKTVVPPEADLEVIKQVSAESSHKGDTVTWTIIVTNHGPDVAINAIAEDVIPSTLIYTAVDITVSKGEFTSNKWTIGDMANGETQTMRITTVVNATNTTIENNVNVTSETPDPNETNNNDSNETVVPPEADLEVIKQVSAESSHKGDTVTWTIIVTNHGPDEAINVIAEDIIPSQLIYTASDITVSKGTFTDNKWSIGDMANGETQTMTITTKVNVTNDTIVNNVNVTSETYDPNETNNNDSNKTDVPPEADLEVIKEVSAELSHKGDTVIWTIIVTNHGPDAAINAYAEDVIPSGLIYTADDITVSKGDFANNKWTIGDMANGETQTMKIITKVDVTSTTIVNNVNVTSETYDPNETNNNDSNKTVVSPDADLEVIKEVSAETSHKGDTVTWTIIVTNHGPDEAINVIAEDIIPSQLTYTASDITVSKGTFTNNKWTIGDMANGETQTMKITTIVNATNTTIVNNVNVTSETYDPNETNNNDSNKTVVPPEADLEVIKEVSAETSHKGDTVTWTITVINHGPDAAINAYAEDVIPSELIFTADDVTVSKGDFANNIWTIGDMANGETQTMTIKTTVNVTNETVVNNVNVTSETYDPNETNNNDSNKTVVPPEADLNVTKEVSEQIAHIGDIVTWTITVINNGPDGAINSTAIDSLPAGLIYDSDDSNGAYDPKTGIWNIGNLSAGSSATLTIKTIVNASNVTITNNVNVTSDIYDPNETNNKDNDSVPVEPECDLEIIKIVSNKTIHKGDKVIWTLIVTNHGPDAAMNVVVTDKLPNGLAYVSDNVKGAYNPKTGIWKVGNLAKGQSATLNIVSLVKTTNKTITNLANVSSDTYDPNEDNNKANNSTTVPPECDLVLTIDPNVVEVTVGDKVGFTVTVVNQGPDTAENCVAYIEIPEELKLLGFKPSKGTYDPNTGIWTIGDLAPGEKVTLTLNTKALKTGTFVVKARTECDTFETDYTNNNDSAKVKVNAPPEPPVHDGPVPPVHGGIPLSKYPTGNPIVMVLLAMLVIVSATLKRKS